LRIPRTLVELAEEVADGQVSSRKLAAARRKATADDPEYDPIDYLENGNDMSPDGAAIGAAVYSASSKMTVTAAGNTALLASYAPQLLENDLNEDDPANLMDAEEFAQAGLVRDIFGNPFRPVTVDPTWLTSTVTSLAQAIYTDRAFDRFPILADALEDAGCSSRELLDHCRQPGEHVRGCWTVELLLKKE
jgi:hypothetical protein